MAQLAFNLNDGNEFAFEIDEDFMTLGRDSANSIVINNSYISSFHAEFRKIEGCDDYEIVDVKSFNGIEVNGQKVERARLKDRDKIAFGQLFARYSTHSLLTSGNDEQQTAPPITPAVKTLREQDFQKADTARESNLPSPLTPNPKKTEAFSTKTERDLGLNGATMRIPILASEDAKAEGEQYCIASSKLQEIETKLNERAERLLEIEATIDRMGGENALSKLSAQTSPTPSGTDSELAKLKTDISDLESKLSRSQTDASAQIKDLEKSLSILKDERDLAVTHKDEALQTLRDTETKSQVDIEQLAETSKSADAKAKELDQLRAQLTDSESSLNEFKAKTADLERSSGDTAKELEQAKQQLSERQAEIEKAHAATERLAAQSADSSKSADDKAKELDQLRAQLTDSENSLNEFKAKTADLERSSGDTAKELEQARQQLSERQAEIEKAHADTERLAAQSADSSKSADDKAKELDHLRAQLAERDTKVADTENSLNELKAKTTDIERSSGDTAKELEQAKQQLSERQAEIEKAHAATERLAAQSADSSKSADDKAKELDHLRAQLAERDTKVVDTENSLNELKAKTADLELSLTEARAANKTGVSLTELKKTLDSKKQELQAIQVEARQNDSLKAERQTLENDLSSLREKIEQETNRRDGLEARAKELAADVAKEEGRLTEIRNAQTELMRSEEQRREEVSGIEKLIEAKASARDEIAAAVAGLSSQRDVLSAQLADLKAQADRHQGISERIETAEAKLRDTTERNEKLRAENTAVEQELASRKSQVESLESQATGHRETVTRLESDVAEAKAVIAEGNAADLKLEETASFLQTRKVEIVSSENRLNALKEDLARETTSIEELVAKRREADALIEHRKTEISRLDETLKATDKAKERLHDVESEIDAGKAQLDALKTQINAMEPQRKEAATLDEQLRVLRQNRGTAEEKLRLLSEDKTELEGEIGKLQVDLNKANEARSEATQATRHLEEIRRKIEENQGVLDKISGAEGRLTAIQQGVQAHLEEKESMLAQIMQIQHRQGILQSDVSTLEAKRQTLQVHDEQASEVLNRVEELKFEVEHLESRRVAVGSAPDLETATTEVFAKDIIKRLDLLDSLIARFSSNGDYASQLRLFRQSLVDLLKMHGISEFALAPGESVDLNTRHRIKVIEVLGDDSGPRKVLETIRAGFICSPAAGQPSILRKAEVILTGSS